jgi:uncharacterized protein (TIGR02302 family)
LASASLFFERLWRKLIFPMCIVGLFFCLSFAGLWLNVPHEVRIGLVLLLAGWLALSLLGLLRITLPTRMEALDRIDQVSGFPHRPASVLDDTLANAGNDAVTQTLWVIHRRRALTFLDRLKPGTPSPRAVDIDRYALRSGILVALIACAFLAGPEKYARVAAAFDWRRSGLAGPAYRLDAWIDPPPYTGKAPSLLNLATPEAKSQDHPMAVEAPVGSIIIVRAAGGDVTIDARGGLAAAAIDPAAAAGKADASKPQSNQPHSTNPPPPKAAEAENEHRLRLTGDSTLVLHHGGTLAGAFQIHAIADRPPTIALTDVPRANARGSLSLAYRLDDDYGVTSAQARFSDPRNADHVTFAGRSLVKPPQADLALAPGHGGLGDAESTIDLSDHPWAGLRVTMTLAAKDEGGNEGVTAPAEIILPRKPFTNPLARALAEQRRNLLLQPDDRSAVWTALSGLMIAPEAFDTTTSVYLGLRLATDWLASAKGDDDLVALADFLWEMALQIENGNLADAERELRNAEQNLRDAMQRNASQEELSKLTQELRTAMDKFMKELAEQDQNRGDRPPEQAQGESKSVTPKDLQAMLDKLQNLAKSGNMAEAQKALEQLQNILENLKTAKRSNSNSKARDTNRALNDLDKMSKDQQDLRDQTYQQGRRKSGTQAPSSSPSGGKRPSPGQQNPDDGDDDEDALMDPQGSQRQPSRQAPTQQDKNDALQQRQQALRKGLEDLQKRLKQMGQVDQGLDDAQSAMQEAERALGEQGQEGRDEAVEAQGRALDSLQKGSQKLAEQMKQQQGEGQAGGEGEGEDGGSQQSSEGSGDTDPLGRPRSNSARNPGANAPFDPMGAPAAQRAQRVLDELRRRLGNPNRPHEELDYLERLLRSN